MGFLHPLPVADPSAFAVPSAPPTRPVRYRPGVSELAIRIPVRLGGHPGELVRSDGPNLVWQGDITPTLVADLMRSGSEGPVAVQHPEGDPQPAWIQRLWFDLERGRMIVHLLDRGMVA